VSQTPQSPPPEAGDPAPGNAQPLGALIIPLTLAAIGVYLVVGTLTMDEVGDDNGIFGPRMMPWLVAALALSVAITMTIDVLRSRRRSAAAQPAASGPAERSGEQTGEQAPNWRAVAIAVAGVVAFIVLLPFAGWLISATLLFVVIAMSLGNRNHATSLIAGLALASVIQIVFSGFLGLNLPAGFIGSL